jgi:two-component system LytT family response regulator
MIVKAVIVDDEPGNRKQIRGLLNEYFPQVSVVAEADSVSSAVEVIRHNQPDLVLLDIEIKEGTGFQVLQRLKPYSFKLIFITGFNNFAIKAFKFSAMDYILKPVNEVEFQQAVQNALQSIDSEQSLLKQNDYLVEYFKKETQLGKIILKTNEAIHVIDVSDIIYCRSDNAYTTFYIYPQEEITVSKNLKEYVELLGDYGFFRPHQSYLVNLNYVKMVDKADGGFVVLKNKKEIPVSQRQKKRLIRLLENI